MTMARHVELKSGVRGGIERGADRLVYSTADIATAGRRDGRGTAEERERADILSVALAQPHRRGCDDPRLGTALGRFCAFYKPRPLGGHCWQAGNRYAEIVRQAKTALGMHIHGWAPSDGGFEDLDEAQLEARKEAALMRLDEAQAILREIMPRLPAAMERLVYDDLEPAARDVGMIVNGLVKLAIEWGMLRPAPR